MYTVGICLTHQLRSVSHHRRQVQALDNRNLKDPNLVTVGTAVGEVTAGEAPVRCAGLLKIENARNGSRGAKYCIRPIIDLQL